MQVLKYIEDSFNLFSKKAKLSLFIFPLVIFALLFFYFTKGNENSGFVKNANIYNKIKVIKMNENIVDILKNIEKEAKRNSLKINAISSDKKSINLELILNKKQMIKFLKYLEDYNSFSELKSLSIVGQNLKLELVFEDLYIKEKLDLKNRISKVENAKKVFFYLNAIVGEKAYINNKWLNINDEYKNFKVIKIDANGVYLQGEYEIIKLKMYKNENI